MTTVVADRIRDIEGEVVTALYSRYAQQLTVLLLAEVLLQVAVQGTTTGEVLNVFTSVETETIQDVQTLVLYYVEIAVVAITRYYIAVLFVPFSVFHTHVLGRDHLAVEHNVLRAVLFVLLLDDTEQLLNEVCVFGCIFDLQAEELSSLHQTVHTDGEVLTTDVDITGVEERQHAFLLQVLEVLVVSQLHFVHEVHYILDVSLIRDVITNSVLDSTVEVDGEHRFRARRDTTGTKRIAEAIVSDCVTQTAARRETVGIIGYIGEERVTFGIHLCGEIAVLFVLDVSVLSQERHRLNREGQDATGTLFVEPIHETTLQPIQALPMRSLTVRETEVIEQALEIVAVIVADIPEDRLEVTSTRRLIQAIYDLLEVVGDDLIDRTTLEAEIDYLVRTFVVILTKLLLNEIVHIHQELRRSASTGEHR